MASATNANPNNSPEVVSPPTDAVSSLCFSPKANYLVATSWDNQVRCWEVTKNGTSARTMAKTSMAHDQPVLCSTWKDDGATVFSGGCDKQVKMWPLLSGGQPTTVAMHDSPVTQIAWISEMNLLVSGSLDKTLSKMSFPLLLMDMNNTASYHTFATAGSDGAFHFWDKDSKNRLKAMLRCAIKLYHAAASTMMAPYMPTRY
ncbi:hypothetical protein R6Q57_020101 [Mikania cordata]